jgi:excisionase family DNA binding protein
MNCENNKSIESSTKSGRLALSVSETAKAIGVSIVTLYREIRANRFPAVKIGHRRWIVPFSHLERWLSENSFRNKDGRENYDSDVINDLEL